MEVYGKMIAIKCIRSFLYVVIGILLSIGGIGILEKPLLFLGILLCVGAIDGFSRGLGE